jgi:ribosomal protein L3
MTRVVKGNKIIPVTLIKIPELIVAQVKTKEID